MDFEILESSREIVDVGDIERGDEVPLLYCHTKSMALCSMHNGARKRVIFFRLTMATATLREGDLMQAIWRYFSVPLL